MSGLDHGRQVICDPLDRGWITVISRHILEVVCSFEQLVQSSDLGGEERVVRSLVAVVVLHLGCVPLLPRLLLAAPAL